MDRISSHTPRTHERRELARQSFLVRSTPFPFAFQLAATITSGVFPFSTQSTSARRMSCVATNGCCDGADWRGAPKPGPDWCAGDFSGEIGEEWGRRTL